MICCGVGGYFLFNMGMGVVVQELKNEVADDPNVETHLGEIKSLSGASCDVMVAGIGD